MCYSAEVSRNTFLFVSVLSTYLWHRNRNADRPISLILFVVVIMQLVEYGIWTHLECGPTNRSLSAFIPILLYLQPILANLIVWWFKAGWAPGYLPLALAFRVFLPYKIYTAWAHYGKCVKVGEGGHLEWVGVPDQTVLGIIERIIYYAALAYPILTLNNHIFALTFIGLSFLSLALSSKPGIGSTKTWPSIWCHSVNMFAAAALFTK